MRIGVFFEFVGSQATLCNWLESCAAVLGPDQYVRYTVATLSSPTYMQHVHSRAIYSIVRA
jgi:hypothetical protein